MKPSDIIEGLIGNVVTVLPILIFRGGTDGPYLDPIIGFIILAIWISLIYHGSKTMNLRFNHLHVHIAMIFLTCYISNILLSIAFKITTWEKIIANPFGSPPAIISIVGFPVALLFDYKNIKNILKRYRIST